MIRTSVMLLVICGLMLIMIPACSSSSSDVLGTRPIGTVTGLVIDTVLDTPLGDVTVTITSSPFPTDTTGSGNVVIVTTTNYAGTFSRADILNGQIEVEVKLTGYRTPPSQIWALTPGGTGEFRFEMAPGEDPLPDPENDDQNARPPDSQWDE